MSKEPRVTEEVAEVVQVGGVAKPAGELEEKVSVGSGSPTMMFLLSALMKTEVIGVTVRVLSV